MKPFRHIHLEGLKKIIQASVRITGVTTNTPTSKYHTKALLLMPLTQENAVDLQSLGRVPYHLQQLSGENIHSLYKT
jgi:hypothetical protein